MLPRKIDTITLLGLGASIYDWVNLTHKDAADNIEVGTIKNVGHLIQHDA